MSWIGDRFQQVTKARASRPQSVCSFFRPFVRLSVSGRALFSISTAAATATTAEAALPWPSQRVGVARGSSKIHARPAGRDGHHPDATTHDAATRAPGPTCRRHYRRIATTEITSEPRSTRSTTGINTYFARSRPQVAGPSDESWPKRARCPSWRIVVTWAMCSWTFRSPARSMLFSCETRITSKRTT